MPSGNGGQVGFAKIGSLYRDVNTVNLWTNFVSESMEHKLAELEEGSITGRRDAPPSHKGLDSGEGDISFEPNPNALGHLFKGFFGTLASSLVTNAASNGANSGDFAVYGQNFHRFTPTNSAFSDRTFLEPYNVMVYRDMGSAWLYKGSILHTLKLQIQANQLVKATASYMSRTVDRIDRVAAISSLVSSGGRPWVWDMASVEISTDTTSANLAAATDFEAFNINLALPHDGVPLLDGTKKYAEFVPSDFRRVTFDGTLSFRDQSEYDAFTAYESRRMRITLLNVNSRQALGNVASLAPTAFLGYPGMRFHIPAMKFLSWSAPIGGPNRITASFTAKAEYDDVSGFSIAAELLNIVPNSNYTTAY